MQFSRRAFLSMTGAAALTSALPATSGTVPVTEAIPPEVVGPEYGFTFDDYVFETGFRTLDDAIAAARAYRPGSAFVTARVDRHSLWYPSEVGENVVDHLINGKSLGYDMACWMACANEEGDFEGDFETACHRADKAALVARAKPAIVASLRRAGAPDVADLYDSGAALPGDLPDPLLEAVSTDAVLAAELGAALAEWAEAHRIEDDLRSLIVSGSVTHAPGPVGAPPALAA